MLGADGTSSDRVSNVSINAGPVHRGSGEELHLLDSSVVFLKVCQGVVEHLRESADMVSFGQDTIFNG